jgi:glycosyltransferase involved in cell wall biosynthesis
MNTIKTENEADSLPAVDIVIPTYNSMPYIEECLKLLRSQDYNGITTIIIIDGGSTDATLEICPKYGCKIYENKGMYSNGLTGARNKSLEYCNGDLYWQIDSDNFIYDNSTLSVGELIKSMCIQDRLGGIELLRTPKYAIFYTELDGDQENLKNYYDLDKRVKDVI